MVELDPVEVMLLTVIWLLLGAALASAVMSVLFKIYEDEL